MSSAGERVDEADGAFADSRPPRRAPWIALSLVAGTLAALLTVFTLLALFSRPYVTLAAADLPPGHPHDGIYAAETSFGCSSLVGYALGDRDPLCQGGQRSGAVFTGVGFLFTVACATASVWAWRRGRRAPGAPLRSPSGRGHRVVPGLVAGCGAVVLLLAVAANLPANGGSWPVTATTPPTVPGLRDWQDRVHPLAAAMSSDGAQITRSIERGDMSALAPACDRLTLTAAELSTAAIPAPEPRLDHAAREAVSATSDAARDCRRSVATGDTASLIVASSSLAAAASSWVTVTDLVLELEIGPPS